MARREQVSPALTPEPALKEGRAQACGSEEGGESTRRQLQGPQGARGGWGKSGMRDRTAKIDQAFCVFVFTFQPGFLSTVSGSS